MTTGIWIFLEMGMAIFSKRVCPETRSVCACTSSINFEGKLIRWIWIGGRPGFGQTLMWLVCYLPFLLGKLATRRWFHWRVFHFQPPFTSRGWVGMDGLQPWNWMDGTSTTWLSRNIIWLGCWEKSSLCQPHFANTPGSHWGWSSWILSCWHQEIVVARMNWTCVEDKTASNG